MHATQQLPSTRVKACGPNRAFVRAAVRPNVSTRAYLEEKQPGAGQTAKGINQLEGRSFLTNQAAALLKPPTPAADACIP